MDVKIEMPCPICKVEGKVSMRSNVDDIPYFGEHTQVTILCDSCGWKQSDFIPAEGRKAGGWSLVISEEKRLHSRVVRSSSCTVEIPELELEVNPGSGSSGYVTNVEGVLKRFEEVVQMVQRDAISDASKGQDSEELTDALERCEELLKRLATAFNGDFSSPMTITLLDPRGHSQILHPDAEYRDLTAAELERLPIGPDPAVFQT